jgi:hypothetical protein
LNSSCRLGQAVHGDTLANFLQNTVDNSDDRDTGTYLLCRGYLASLQDFEFIFVLSVLNELFSTADTLFEVLQKKVMDINYCLRKVPELKDVTNYKRSDFDKFCAQIRTSK